MKENHIQKIHTYLMEKHKINQCIQNDRNSNFHFSFTKIIYLHHFSFTNKDNLDTHS